MENKIRIGLVEDQFLFREGIKAILTSWPDIDVVFESGDGYSVIGKLQNSGILPEVMLVDLSLPPHGQKEYSGLELTLDLRQAYPEIKIIILSVHNEEHFIARLITNGAHGYLAKDSDPGEVYQAIKTVHKTGFYMNERTLRAIQQSVTQKIKPKPTDLQITKREQEILQLVCHQHTTEEIAEKLFISVKTVNGHRNNLLQKTGSRNTAGLVMYAIKNGIVDPV